MGSRSKRLRKNRKRNQRRPSLSVLDKLLYTLLIIAEVAAALAAMLFFALFLPETVGFSDPEVIAMRRHNSAGWLFPLCFFLIVSIIAQAENFFWEKQPIFGDKKIRYGAPPWDPTCYPITDPRRRTWYGAKAKREGRRFAIKLWLVGLAVMVFLGGFGLFGRDVLRQDNAIVDYNCLSLPVASYTEEDFASLTIGASYSRRYRSITRHYYCYAEITMEDGRKYRFKSGNFRQGLEGWMEQMKRVKPLFHRENITIEGLEDLPGVADGFTLTPSQEGCLYRIFELPPRNAAGS